MQSVTKEAFEAFIATKLTLSETEMERQGDGYAYENWLDFDGETVAFVTYHDGDAISWHIAA